MEKLKCIECFHTFKQTENPPGKHDKPAGRMDDGRMMYNTECPNCGTFDRMSADYLGIPEDILKQYRENQRKFQQSQGEADVDAVNLQMLLDYRQGKVSEKELREALGML